MRTNFPTVPPSVPKVCHEVCHVLHAKTAKTRCFSRFWKKCASVPIYIYSTVAQFGEQSVAGVFGRFGWARHVRGWFDKVTITKFHDEVGLQ